MTLLFQLSENNVKNSIVSGIRIDIKGESISADKNIKKQPNEKLKIELLYLKYRIHWMCSITDYMTDENVSKLENRSIEITQPKNREEIS